MRLGCATLGSMWNPAAALELPSEQRELLQDWIKAKNTPQKVAFRSRLIVMASEGHANRDIARTLRTSRPTVLLWRRRFATHVPQGLLEDAPGRGRKVQISSAKVRTMVEATLHTRPPRRIGVCAAWPALRA